MNSLRSDPSDSLFPARKVPFLAKNPPHASNGHEKRPLKERSIQLYGRVTHHSEVGPFANNLDGKRPIRILTAVDVLEPSAALANFLIGRT